MNIPTDPMILGWRVVHADLRSSRGYRWPFPGNWAEAPDDGRSLVAGGMSCPDEKRGGLCITKNFYGASSGGIPCHTALLVCYRADDILGEDTDKVRVRRAFVLDMVDIHRMIRERGYGANLSHANLTAANLSHANLTAANLSRANLYGANLYGANLSHANLSRANLSRANLSAANLTTANLSRANLSHANLTAANLSHANLTAANLSRANLSAANLTSANLYGANLTSANLYGARGDTCIHLPSGWKVDDAGLVVRVKQ